MTCRFDGTGIRVLVLRTNTVIVGGNAHRTGRLRISIDGADVGPEISVSNGVEQSGYPAFEIQGMPAGEHTFKAAPVAGWAIVEGVEALKGASDPPLSKDKDSVSITGQPGIILVPVSYQTMSGKDNNQPVTHSIDVLDEDGTKNNWYKYLQFQGRTGGAPYFGTRTYRLPASIASASVKHLDVLVNYLGPLPATQLWTWAIYDWTTGAWAPIGTNEPSQGWKGWSHLVFSVPGSGARFIRPGSNEIELATNSNNAADDADIDYEAVEIYR
jgi:hypothetical protein